MNDLSNVKEVLSWNEYFNQWMTITSFWLDWNNFRENMSVMFPQDEKIKIVFKSGAVLECLASKVPDVNPNL